MKRIEPRRLLLAAALLLPISFLSWFFLPPTKLPWQFTKQPDDTLESSISLSVTLENQLNKNSLSLATFVDGLEHLPDSLHGTDVPTGLFTDASGNLLITSQLRDVYDYFLSTLGEEDIATITLRIRTYLAASLPEKAARQANKILNDYLAWKKSPVTTGDTKTAAFELLDFDEIAQQQKIQRENCQLYLGAQVCTAFFGKQQAYNDYALQRLIVRNDNTLSEEEKEIRLAALFSSLPASLKDNITSITRLQTLNKTVADTGNSNPAGLRQQREKIVGAQAAARLEELDRRRQNFNTRMNEWQRVKASLTNHSGLSSADKQEQIERLRRAHFSSSEIIRVKALENMPVAH